MRRPLPVEQSLAARIARALDAAGADPREVAYLWSFLSSVSGDDSRNDGTVLARAGFGIVARGRRPFDQQKAELLSLLPDDLQATLLNAAPECGDGTAPRLHQENARVSGASEEPHETGGAGFARLVVRPECNGGMIGINVGLLREGIVYEIVEMMGGSRSVKSVRAPSACPMKSRGSALGSATAIALISSARTTAHDSC